MTAEVPVSPFYLLSPFLNANERHRRTASKSDGDDNE